MRRLTLTMSLAALAGFSLAGCTGDNTKSKIQYVPDMADAPTVKTLREYLDPPPHAIAMGATLYPKEAEQADKMLMPREVAESATAVAEGQKLFETYCTICHGNDGKGQGTLNHPAIAPPDLLHPAYATRSDGFYFYRITFGTAVMPPYGHSTDPVERWKIVRYLRTLQKAAQ